MITVLMAAKTSTQYMPNAVGSLLGQSYTDWQLIIGVNGLGRKSSVYQDAWNYMLPNYSKMEVMDLPNCQNKGAALNAMMKDAEGDYIAILDVDDLWHPQKLARQMPWLDFGYDVVGTQAEYFGDIHSDIGAIRGLIDLNTLRAGNCIINSSAVMKREHARWEPMDDPIEDYELWLRLATQGRKMFNTSDYLTFIRQHDGNWSRQGNHETALARLRARYE